MGIDDVLVGIDDTDNLESRGTGHLARELAREIYESGLARPLCVSRHQLLVDPRIPYTSHNSSACVQVTNVQDLDALTALCGSYLSMRAAPGSDAGLCVAPWDAIAPAIEDWGARAQREVLDMAAAHALATRHALALAGFTGTRGGVIGALAAVGLRHAGNDGRVLWLPWLRELSGAHRADALMAQTGLQRITTQAGETVPADARIHLGDWARPVLQNGLITLWVEPAASGEDQHDFEWRVITKDRIKHATEGLAAHGD